MNIINQAKRWVGKQALKVARAANADTGTPTMQRYVLGSARDRWLSASIADYTPERVEAILRGAFAGDLTQQWLLFDLMEQTWPRLAKNLNELKSVLEDHDWCLHAWAMEGEQPSAEALRRKKVVEQVIWQFQPDPTFDENDFGGLAYDLADAWGKGISVQELDWQPLKADGGTVMGLKSARWVHPRHYGYPPNVTGRDQLMLRTLELVMDGSALPPGAPAYMPFPKDKFLIGIAKQKSGHPIGAALLRPLAWWWAVQNFTSECLLNLAQIFGVPIRWATYAQGTRVEQITKIEEMLENMGSAAWGAFPAGTSLELKEAVKTGADNPQIALIGLVDTICDLIVLGQTLTSTAGNRGSQALGRVHQDVLSGRKEAVLRWVAKTLNAQLIPAICRVNFGNTLESPYFFIADEDKDDAKTKAETFNIVLKSGAPIPKQFFYEELGIPQPGPDDEVIDAIAATGPLPGAPGDPQADPLASAAGGSRDLVAGRIRLNAGAPSHADIKLADAVAESITGIEAQWLKGARPWFQRMVAAAQNQNTTDAEFIALIERAQRHLPDEIAPLLDTRSLALAMEKAMGAAAVNGAVQGYLDRKK